MKTTIEAPNGMGWVVIDSSKNGGITLETSFPPFGSHRFLEELEKHLHVTSVKRSEKNTGIYRVIKTRSIKECLSEIVETALEDSKIWEE